MSRHSQARVSRHASRDFPGKRRCGESPRIAIKLFLQLQVVLPAHLSELLSRECTLLNFLVRAITLDWRVWLLRINDGDRNPRTHCEVPAAPSKVVGHARRVAF